MWSLFVHRPPCPEDSSAPLSTNVKKQRESAQQNPEFFWSTSRRKGMRSISPIGHEGNNIAIGIAYLKISSAPRLLGESLREFDAARLEFPEQTLHV